MSSKLTCSFVHTKNAYSKQHFYTCHQCNNLAMCGVCAAKCHKGHVMSYSGVSDHFVCGCGSNGQRFCGSLAPQLCESQSDDVCSYAVTKKQTTFQHFYFCHTCNLVNNLGCCELCAKVCHAGHRTSYAGHSPHFYCDCGSGEGTHGHKCKCLTKRSKSIVDIETEFARIKLQAMQVASAGAQPSPASSGELLRESDLKLLDKEVCSITTLGKDTYGSQHYYHCADCGLVGNSGCCEGCARHCHRGHNVSYAGFAKKFYCDCGNAGPGKCRSLQPMAVVPSHMLAAAVTQCQTQHGGLPSASMSIELDGAAHAPSQAKINAADLVARALDSMKKLADGSGSSSKAAGGASQASHEEEAPAQPTSADADDKYVCKICWENQINTVIVPCGHMALCNTCTKTKRWTTCPICTQPVQSIMQTFFA